MRRVRWLLMLQVLTACSAWGQFQGYFAPQTLGPIRCINAATAPAKSSATPGDSSFINNLGQSVHYLFYQTTGTITFSIQLDGSFTGGTDDTNWFRISETGTVSGSGAIFADVYIPFIRCNLTVASGGGSITANYTATFSTAGPPSGIFNSSGIFTKSLAQAAEADQAATYRLNLPSGTTGGTIYISNAGGFAAGGSLAMTAGPDDSHLAAVDTYTIAASAAQQAIVVRSVAAVRAAIVYTPPPGQAANTYDLSYTFGYQTSSSIQVSQLPEASSIADGAANPATSQIAAFQQLFNGATWDRAFVCNQQAAVTLAGAGNTQIIAASGSTVIRLCHLSISWASGTTVDVSLHQGTGANCATNDTALTGTYQDLDSGVWPLSPLFPVRTTAGQALCVNQGTAVTGGGVAIYAQY